MFSPIFYFVLLAFFCLLAFGIGEVTGWAALKPAKESAGIYYSSLDGLRGILAISVFFVHALLSYYYVQTGNWGGGHVSNFYAQMGTFPVTMFFFVTGFLFWSKLIESPSGTPFFAFIKTRARRILPAYFCSLTSALVILFWQYGLHARVSLSKLATQVFLWVLCGVPFGFPTINGLSASHITTAGVFWTLRIEWAFYLLVPFIGWFARKSRVLLYLLLCVLVNFAIPMDRLHYVAGKLLDLPYMLAHFSVPCFSVGILAAHTRRKWKLDMLRHWLCTPVAIVLWLVAMFVAPPRFGFIESGLLAPIFFMVVFGNDFHGLLTSRLLSFLGTISYSLYVMHGVVLYACTQSMNRFVELKSLDTLQYWFLVGLIGAMVIVVSSLTYRFVEYPWLRKRMRGGIGDSAN